MWKCKFCGETNLKKMSAKTICHKCHHLKYYDKERQKEYQRTIRWLNGGPDNFLLGEKNKSVIVNSINGILNLKGYNYERAKIV